MVLTAEATTMGINCASISPKYNINPTPGGTKKKPKFLIKNFEIASTCLNFTIPNFNESVRSNIPIILDGSLTPVAHTINSPIARNANRIAHCKIIIYL